MKNRVTNSFNHGSQIHDVLASKHLPEPFPQCRCRACFRQKVLELRTAQLPHKSRSFSVFDVDSMTSRSSLLERLQGSVGKTQLQSTFVAPSSLTLDAMKLDARKLRKEPVARKEK